jgi:hypothetical protein
MHLQIIHKYDSFFTTDIMQSKMAKVDGDLQVQNASKCPLIIQGKSSRLQVMSPICK